MKKHFKHLLNYPLVTGTKYTFYNGKSLFVLRFGDNILEFDEEGMKQFSKDLSSFIKA